MKTIKHIAVSVGDPNGIGPEIALKSAVHYLQEQAFQPVLAGDRFVLEHYRKLLGVSQGLKDFREARPGQDIAICDVAALAPDAFKPGEVSAAAGLAMIAYVKACVELAQSGAFAAIAGCPQNETAVHAAGIEFSGYPPLIADLTHTPREDVFMMLSGAGLRIAHVTLHEPLSSAVQRLTPELVAAAARALHDCLQRLGIDKPKIALFGINPHASENGLFGDDDARITEPAAANLRAQGLDVDGPAGADVLLANRKHDGYVAMYHDQGHVPVKLISPRQASALAIGAPVVFSSVGHGSAHDIAGKGVAQANSVIETLALLASVRAA
ncbi:MAG: terephthalate dihydrodiol dehydrogenase [Alphaproteobacteria bacterium]|nr:terephthalate dihydrodiol dehydrogenase [Alphaproteobacteria bacterium]